VTYENEDGLVKSLAATFGAHVENGKALANLEDARLARLDGRKNGPRQNDARPAYVHQPFPKAMHHADGRVIEVANEKAQAAAEKKDFRAEHYPVVRVALADPEAEKAARKAADAETAGKIASQNDLIQKLFAQVAALAEKK
jgi:biotin carboxyl carrier protein